jgi:hypothetical protein
VSATVPRPAEVCRALLRALEGSEGRRRRRKRDTTPDRIGLQIRRDLLERAVADDPAPEAFEAWLHARCLADGRAGGPRFAIAQELLADVREAARSPTFADWIARATPSDEPS